MALSSDLISQFVKTTNDKTETKKESSVYGVVEVDENGKPCVRIDGSDRLTPVKTTTLINEGDKVTVTIKNHTAVVTGNLASPAINENGILNVKAISAAIGRIDALETANLTVQGRLNAVEIIAESFNAATADIVNLKAEDVKITNTLTAVDASIKSLDTEKLSAEDAKITYATITELNAAKGNITILESDIADINTLIFGTASGTTIHTSFANAVIAQLGQAQIKSAMIESIVTNDIDIKSNDGRLFICDETIQISDENRVRVQIGKDEADDYSINVWDQNGNLMFSKGGITDAAIKDAIIRNDMVAENANISSYKVYLDDEGKTLDVGFKELETTVSDQGETISSHGASISANTEAISTKVWQQDIDTAVDNIEVGGRNLLLNSSFSKDYSKWSANNNDYSNVTEKYGRKCGRINHDTLNKNKYFYQSILNRLEPNSVYKISGWMLTENIVQGTTSPSCMFYTDGYYVNENGESKWFSIGSIDIPMNPGTGEWVKITGTFKTDDVKFNSATSLNFFVHTRDITGDIYFSELKLEKGNKVTDWSPAPEDVKEDITTLSTQYSEINQTVSGISTIVAGHTTEISNKADLNTVTTINDKVTTLEQNLDGFKTTVSETYATVDSVDAIEPGGRNLLLNSDTVKTTTAYSMSHYTPSSPLVAGETYTMSLCVTPAEGVSYYEAYVSGGYTVIAKLYPTGTDKQVLTHTFTAKYSSGRTPDDNISHADIYLYRFPNDGTVTGASTIHWIKVEKGSKATDWTAAPEDIAAEIADLNTQTIDLDMRVTSTESSITQLSDSITTNVTDITNLGTRMTTVEQTSTDLTARLTVAENDILSAAQTATNYMNFSNSGLVIGNLTADTLGKNILIDSDSVDIRSGETVRASFGEDYLYLAKHSRNAKIDLCNGLVEMYHASSTSYDTIFVIDTPNITKVRGTYNPMMVESTVSGKVAIQFANTSGTLGSIGMVESASGAMITRNVPSTASTYTVLDTGNFYTMMDSGWLTCAINTSGSFTVYDDSSNIRYRKIGKLVEVVGAVKPKTTLTGGTTNYVFATLPSGYRPAFAISEREQGSGGHSWLFSITTGGDLRYSRYSNGADCIEIPAGTWLPFHAMFFTN